ncbi:IS630 transposase-related protein [Thermosynechococcaceae cyanobacterium BACA0444]|uniref:IS630 transposase-related protein n=1 Tax=Pseudocalidococcus azoricus BACA0444 TaxID=2918990 RepID=A0AAE4FPS5_9CYAN|nr:IS630 transposase-related protein [Pseudocalidococcus azoricus]MDS3859876.1 IS630 transposase-related protein [Pseudocalidococcus azoricus BACA0444]
MAYSADLRKKAIEAVAQGAVKAQLCKTLNINRNTLDLWINQYLETGSFAPRSYHHQRRKPKIKDLDKFKDFVLKNSDKTQAQLAKLWGDNLNQQDVSRALKRLNISRRTQVGRNKKKV